MQNSSSIVSNFEYLEKMAEQGDALALFRLGKCYSVGHGVTKDFEKAVDCFMSAAQQDNSYAQFELGLCYHHGIGVQEDAKKAFEWYEKAALQGNNIAQCHLGSCYQKGYGTVKNYGKAAQWYARSANQQNAKAFNNLAFLYEQGRGVNKDYNKAFRLYSRSADLGFIPALANVGYCYEKGLGSTQSYRKAASFYRQAAEKGNEYAKNALKRIIEKEEEEELFYSHQKVGDMTYARVIPFGENYIVKRHCLWGIVDEHNTPLLPLEYEYIQCYEGGYAGIQKNDLCGLADSMGTIIIEPQYEMLRYLSQHQACDVEQGGDRFLVDINNNVILRVRGKTIKYYGDKLLASSEGEQQLYNMDGTPFSKVHLLFASVGEHYVAYDFDGETLIKKDGSEVQNGFK